MFKKSDSGKYDLYEVLEALYSIPELKDSGIAKKIFKRLDTVKIGLLKTTILKNIPQSHDFRSEEKELLIVCHYVIIRLDLLKQQLLKINKLYK